MATRTTIKRRKTYSVRRDTRAGFLFTMPVIIGFILFTVGPLLVSLYLSFTDYDMVGSADWVGIANYQRLFSGEDPVFLEVPSGDGVLRADRHPIYLIVSLAIAMLLNRSFGAEGLPEPCFTFPPSFLPSRWR